MKEGTEAQDFGGPAPERGRLSRRTFCRRACLSTAALAAAPALASAAQDSPPPEKKIEGAELLMLGYAMTFRYPTERDLAILIRTLDGGYHAYVQNCTHMGCPVNFDRASSRLECPCHQGAYDTQTGAVVSGPPPRALTRIELELRRGGEVWAVGRG